LRSSTHVTHYGALHVVDFYTDEQCSRNDQAFVNLGFKEDLFFASPPSFGPAATFDGPACSGVHGASRRTYP